MTAVVGDAFWSDVAVGLIGAVAAAVFAVGGWGYRRWSERRREKRSNQSVWRLLDAMFTRFDSAAGWEAFESPAGLYYKRVLATELLLLARDHRTDLGGDVYLGVIRVVGALRLFSFKRGEEDSGIYSVDQLLYDIRSVIELLAPETAPSKEYLTRRLRELAGGKDLMRAGVLLGTSGELLTRRCARGRFTRLRGDLWLLRGPEELAEKLGGDGLLRVRMPLAGTIPPDAERECCVFEKREVERLASEDPSNCWIPAAGIRAAHIRVGWSTSKIKLSLNDGQHIELRWPRADAANDLLQDALDSWHITSGDPAATRATTSAHRVEEERRR